MDKRFLTLVIVTLTGLLFLAVGALTAAEKAADVPDEVLIKNEGYKKDKKGPVKLFHKKHSMDYKVACTDCHHEYKDGKNIWKEGNPVEKCSKCHDPQKDQGKAKKLQNAYHKNCKDCHKEVVKKNKEAKAPFKKCKECHEKS